MTINSQNLSENTTTLAPELDVMSAFLEAVFGDVMADGMIEIAYTLPDSKDPRQARMFPVGDFDDAAAFAAGINEKPGQNVYVGPALRRPDMGNQRSADKDIILMPVLFADFDEDGSAEKARDRLKEAGMLAPLVTVTGRLPHTRAHFYWKLEDPITDQRLFKNTQSHIAEALGADPACKNPSRLMRLPGTVAWAKKDGRQDEMTELQQPKGRRQRFNAAEISSRLTADVAEIPAPTTPKPIDRKLHVSELDTRNADNIAKMLQGDNWHVNMVEAVGRMVRVGDTDEQIQATFAQTTLPGYTVQETIDEVQVAINGARAKGFDKQLVIPAAPTGPFLTLDELLDLPPPEFLIDGVLVDQGVGFLAGASQSLKSFLATYFAASIANGVPIGDRATKQSGVLYTALEGFSGIGWRYLAAMQHHNLHTPILFNRQIDLTRPESVDDICRNVEQIDNLKLIIIDTFSKSKSGADENSASDMEPVVEQSYRLADKIGGMVLLVHHLGKDEKKGMRGSSSLHAGVDNVLLLKRPGMGMDLSLLVKKVKDGEDGFYVNFKAHPIEVEHPATGELRETLVVDSTDKQMPAPHYLRLILDENPGLTREEIRKMSQNMSLGVKSGNVSDVSLTRALDRYVEKGKITRDQEKRHFLADVGDER